MRHGHNKDHENLEQINLAVLFGEASQLPFYYRKLPGNISDVMTVQHLVREISILFGSKKVKLVLDRGFYSEKNVNAMLAVHLKFVLGVKMSLTYVHEMLAEVRDEMRSYEYYNPDKDLYMTSKTIDWKYNQARPYKGDTINEDRRMYLHIYFSSTKYIDDERSLNKELVEMKTELETGKPKAEKEKRYKKYFVVKSTPVRGIKVSVKQEEIDKAKKNYGYFAMISNEIKDPLKAIELYRSKDLIEKTFDNVKDRLKFSRTHVSSEMSLDGKLFVEFIALIIMSEIEKRMDAANLFRKYTMLEVLDQIDLIECYEYKGKKARYSELIDRQVELYKTLGFNPPT